MIITALLAMIVVFFMFYQSMSVILLGILCLCIGLSLMLMKKHEHGSYLMIDVLVQKSRLYHVNTYLKFWTAIVMMAVCVLSKNPLTGMIAAFLAAVFLVCAGGLEAHDYLSILSIPALFLLISGLALLFEYSQTMQGVFQIPVFSGYLIITKPLQIRAIQVMAKAFGAVSCLYLLSLTTPMTEIIGVLKKLHVPGIMIELMYLIYRYIFILLEMHHTMKDASMSRMGYFDYRTSIRTTGSIYSNLLARSYRKATQMFDAMESRCFSGEIGFLDNVSKISVTQILASCSVIAIIILTAFV